jgi:chemotaxis protein MotB
VSGEYGNWELSTDRANAARHLMQAHGVKIDQVTQVRGFADQKLRKRDQPFDPSNRRISVIVQYIVNNDEEQTGEASESAATKGEEPSAHK